LHTYRPNPDEVEGFVRVRLDDALALFTGSVRRIEAMRTSTADGLVESIELTGESFIPTLDRYFLRVAIAARRFLAGETLIVV
jgi:hypothetical protein